MWPSVSKFKLVSLKVTVRVLWGFKHRSLTQETAEGDLYVRSDRTGLGHSRGRGLGERSLRAEQHWRPTNFPSRIDFMSYHTWFSVLIEKLKFAIILVQPWLCGILGTWTPTSERAAPQSSPPLWSPGPQVVESTICRCCRHSGPVLWRQVSMIARPSLY